MSIAPVVIPDLIIEFLFKLRMFLEVLICGHGADLLLFIEKDYKFSNCDLEHNTHFGIVLFITLSSWTSAISFSKRSDSFKDFSSASFNSTSYNHQ